MKKLVTTLLIALILGTQPAHAVQGNDLGDWREACQPANNEDISAEERPAGNESEQAINMKIKVYLETQQLELLNDAGDIVYRYPVSTAKNGAGELINSNRTPRGKHVIRAKIGENCPENSVFVRRRVTGEVYSSELAQQFPRRDWVLSRILWLSGQEVGFNRLGNRDSMRRFIYIHGTPDSEPMGVPLSHGCIRMRNADIIELFSIVSNGTEVEIVE